MPQAYNVGEPAELLLGGEPLILDVTCNGASDGSIDIFCFLVVRQVIHFDWSNDGTGDFNDPEDLTGVSGGMYTVVVRDANGCEKTATYTIDEPDELLITNAVITNASCYQESDGSIDITVNRWQCTLYF